MNNLFIYGSLLDGSLRRRLLGRDVPTLPAKLENYTLRRSKYYYVVAEPGSAVEGLVLSGLSLQDLSTIDRYEEAPALYERQILQVLGSDGNLHEAWVYLPTEGLLSGVA